MFKFDHAALPQLALRKALIIVDFQKDFIAPDGALQVTQPEGYVERTLNLASTFRSSGDIAWVTSRYEGRRQASEVKIITMDTVARPHSGPREDGKPDRAADVDHVVDLEAFLSQSHPVCICESSSGYEMPSAVLSAIEKKDMVLTKSHYSAFEDTTLLRSLRAKMITEVYICGSLANIGVHATAVDAAGHGMAITIVEDCCGYRSEERQSKAMKSLIDLTGCDIMPAEEVLKIFCPSMTCQPEDQKHLRLALPSEVAKSLAGLSLDHTTKSQYVRGQAEAEPRRGRAPRQHDAPKVGELAEIFSQDSNKTTEKGHPHKNRKGSATKDETATRDVRATAESISPPTKQDMKQILGDIMPDSPPEQQVPDLKGLCEGDTDIIEGLLPASLEADAFEKLRAEIQWQRMSHQGGEVPRLIAVQGEVGEYGSIPIYRHPSDESPPLLAFTPTVQAIRVATEKHLGHSLNHVLIQFYRDGHDYISEHSDKTLDIVRGSYIANVSLGAQRTMVFRTKRPGKERSGNVKMAEDAQRRAQRAPLPHNSLCRMGLKTNMKWLHSIRQDKRADREKSGSELAYNGARISLTFRQIGTFLSQDESKIWGQGATAKSRDGAKEVINGQREESVQLLRAFGAENNSSVFDWDAHYGKGFDVLHLQASPRLFASTDGVINMRIRLMLAEYGINYVKGSMGSGQESKTNSTIKYMAFGSPPVKYLDNNEGNAEVQGDMAIMLYLHSCHQKKKSSVPASDYASLFTMFQRALALLPAWRTAFRESEGNERTEKTKACLSEWDDTIRTSLRGMPFMGGEIPNLPDFAFWPVLHEIMETCGSDVVDHFANLKSYYHSMETRESTAKVLARDNVRPGCQ